MAKTRGAAGAAMTDAPRQSDARPRQGDPLEAQVVDEQLAAARSVMGTDDAIAARAYELYLARGGTHGADMDDWLQAERELREERQQERGQADLGSSYVLDNPAHRPTD
jgi:hypothetical protein